MAEPGGPAKPVEKELSGRIANRYEIKRPLGKGAMGQVYEARDTMLEATDTAFAPWYIVPSDDKRRARLNCISHLLGLIPYGPLAPKTVALPERSMEDAYDDRASLAGRRFVAARF